jgi:hypothetical protein
MPDARRVIPKGTLPYVCRCGVACYRVWDYSNDTERQEPTLVDCEGEGGARPRKLVGGVGAIHQCRSKESAA